MNTAWQTFRGEINQAYVKVTPHFTAGFGELVRLSPHMVVPLGTPLIATKALLTRCYQPSTSSRGMIMSRPCRATPRIVARIPTCVIISSPNHA